MSKYTQPPRGSKRDPIRDVLDTAAISGQIPSVADIAKAIPDGTSNLSALRRRLDAAAEEVAAMRREGRNGDAREAAREHERILLRDIGDERPPKPSEITTNDPAELAALVSRGWNV